MSDKGGVGGPSERGAPASRGRALAVARATLERARATDVDLEVYAQLATTVEIKAFSGQVESVVVAEPQGVAVRAVKEGRMGYAYTSDLSAAGMERVVSQATAIMEAASADPVFLLPEPPAEGYPNVGPLWSPAVSETDLETKVGLVLEAEATAKSCPDIQTVEQAAYVDEDSEIAIVSTRGVESAARYSRAFLYVFAHSERRGDRQSGMGFACGRGPDCLDPRMVGEEAAGKAAALLGGRACPTGVYTVVFAPEVTAALLSSLVRALSAESVQKGRSIFAERLGQQIGSPVVHVWDDGHDPAGLAASPFDAEGVPTRQTSLIQGGVLRSFLYDTRTARRQGGDARSTGNAGRSSYRTPPSVMPTNIILAPGQGDLVALLERVGDGLYVETVSGLHSGVNTVSGEISVGVAGRRISGGALGEPVREVTVATSFSGLLASVVDLAGDVRWVPLYGSVRGCSMAVRDMVVAGR